MTQAATAQPQDTDYTVLVEAGASTQAARAAVRAAGGRVTAEITAVGTLTVKAPATGFVQRVTAADASTCPPRSGCATCPPARRRGGGS